MSFITGFYYLKSSSYGFFPIFNPPLRYSTMPAWWNKTGCSTKPSFGLVHFEQVTPNLKKAHIRTSSVTKSVNQKVPTAAEGPGGSLQKSQENEITSLAKLLRITNPNYAMSVNSKKKILILKRFLGVSRINSTTQRRICPSWKNLSVAHCEAVADTLKSVNLVDKISLAGTSLFSLSPTALRHQHSFLQECGVTIFHPNLFLNFRKLLQLPFLVFKRHANVDKDIVGYWISHLPEYLHEETHWLIRTKAEKGYDSPVAEIRDFIGAKFLSWRFNSSFEEALKCMQKATGKSSPQSIKSLIEAVDTLTKAGFKEDMFFRNPALLKAQGEELRLLLENTPTVLGEKTENLIYDCPNICTYDLKYVGENVKLLADFELPLQTLKKHIEILAMDPWELKEKMDVIKCYPELKVLSHNPNFSTIFHNMENVQIRLNALRVLDRRRVSCTSLLSSKDAEYVRLIDNTKHFMIPIEIVNYLTRMLEKPVEEIFAALKTHPHWKEINAENVKYVTDFLQEKKFTKAQIFNGILLVLYPLKEVASAVEEVEKSNQEENKFNSISISHVNVLQYVLYLIEQRGNFSGNRVFMFEESDSSFDTGFPDESPDK